jgi:hypothetical protein
MQLWFSEDNIIWSMDRELDLAHEDRVLGVTDLKLSPSISGTYFKLTPIDSSYLVAGNTALSVSEIHPLMASGIDFYGHDGSSSSDFREWKLTYDSNSKEVVGYIDGVAVSKGKAPEFYNGGKFIISHDLTVVSSGTHSDFDAQVKDFSVVFGDNLDLGNGQLNHVSVSPPTISGSYENYTMVSTTSSGLYILDKDFDLLPIPDRKIFINNINNQQGSYEDTTVNLFENGIERGEGLLFVGTSRAGRNVPEIEEFSTRPYWLDASPDRDTGSPSRMVYGNRASLIYMSNINKYLVIFDQNAGYMYTLDLRTGNTLQLQRFSWMAEHERDSPFDYHLGSVKGAYVARLSTVWHWAQGIKIAELNPVTSEVTSLNVEEEPDEAGSRYKYTAYNIHDNSFYMGRSELRGVNVLTGKQIKPYRNQTSALNLSNSDYILANMPWGGGGFGSTDGVYCDLDRCIYIIGKNDPSFDTGHTYFLKYNASIQEVTVLNYFSHTEIDYPYSEKDVELNSLGRNDTDNLVYCPLDKKIYHIGNKGPRPALKAFDVVSQTWEETGSTPPYVSAKQWPDDVTLNYAYHTNYVCYDHSEESLVFSTANTLYHGDKYFLYKPSVDETIPTFDYQPNINGLTTSSGQHLHFPSNELDVGLNVSDGSYSSNFDYQVSFGNAGRHHSVYTEPDDITTVFSGTSANSEFNFGHTIQGDGAIIETSTTKGSLEPLGGFDVHFDFSMPSYDLNVFADGTDDIYKDGVPRMEFMVSVSDGYGNPTAPNTSTYGFESDAAHQQVSARMGVVGTEQNDTSDYDLKAYLRWVDGFNDGINSATYYPRNRLYGQDTYVSSPVDLVSAFSDFKHGFLTYDYETDLVEFFVEGISCGSYTMRRKFDTTYGLYLSLGFSSRMENEVTTKEWVVKIRNLSFKRKSYDSIKDSRLLTTISGAVGGHLNERTDSSLVRNKDWVYQCDMYIPSSFKFPGYEYIATLGAMEDDFKTAELVAYVGKDNRKSIGIVGDLRRRDDSSTYLGSMLHQWDDIDLGHYRLEKSTVSGTVSLFVGDETSPSITVDYDSLPAGGEQRMYYGKAPYGEWEKVYTEPVKSGAWTSTFILTGYGTAQEAGKMSLVDSAYFALVDQGSAGTATYTLDENLGEVDVYAFFLSQGYDLAIDTPHVVTASGVVSLPVDVGPTSPISSVQQFTDENSAYDEFKTLVRVNQARDFEGTLSSTAPAEAQTSGWVHLGRYDNPTSVKVTASGTVGTASTIGLISVDAIGVDIGKYGLSTASISTGRVRYNTGATSFYDDTDTKAGITVIDTSDGKVIASFGEDIPDQLKSGDIIDGSNID